MTANHARVVFLEISSWVGISIGAVHAYGKLVWHDGAELKHLELEHPMSAKEAAYYNKEMAARGYNSCRKKPGDPSTDFSDDAAVIRAAKATVRRLWLDGRTWLILGSCGTMSAQPVLVWPSHLRAQAGRSTKLAEEWKRIGGYEGNDRRAGQIDKEWQRIFYAVQGKEGI